MNTSASLFNTFVSDTYPRLIQIFSGSYYDGLGNEVTFPTGSQSNPSGNIFNIVTDFFDLTQSITNPTFSLTFIPVPSSENVFYNGQKLRSGSNNDYLITDNNVYFINDRTVTNGDWVEVQYYSGSYNSSFIFSKYYY